MDSDDLTDQTGAVDPDGSAASRSVQWAKAAGLLILLLIIGVTLLVVVWLLVSITISLLTNL